MPQLTLYRPGLEDLGLGWLENLREAPLYNMHLITDLLGPAFYEELLSRMAASHVYERWLCEYLVDDCLAYWSARCMLADRNEPLVITLLPDMAQHFFMLYDDERIALQEAMAGELILHDPADSAALVNLPEAIAKTRRLMDKHGIKYHDELWQDHLRFPDGAIAIPTGVMSAAARHESWRV